MDQLDDLYRYKMQKYYRKMQRAPYTQTGGAGEGQGCEPLSTTDCTLNTHGRCEQSTSGQSAKGNCVCSAKTRICLRQDTRQGKEAMVENLKRENELLREALSR